MCTKNVSYCEKEKKSQWGGGGGGVRVDVKGEVKLLCNSIIYFFFFWGGGGGGGGGFGLGGSGWM